MKYDLITEIKAKTAEKRLDYSKHYERLRLLTKDLSFAPNAVTVNQSSLSIFIEHENINIIFLDTGLFEILKENPDIAEKNFISLLVGEIAEKKQISGHLKNDQGVYFLSLEKLPNELSKLNVRFYDEEAIETLISMELENYCKERTYTYNGIIPDDEYEIEVEGNIYQIANQILTTDMITKQKGKARTRTN